MMKPSARRSATTITITIAVSLAAAIRPAGATDARGHALASTTDAAPASTQAVPQAEDAPGRPSDAPLSAPAAVDAKPRPSDSAAVDAKPSSTDRPAPAGALRFAPEGDVLGLELREGGPIVYDPVERGTSSASTIARRVALSVDLSTAEGSPAASGPIAPPTGPRIAPLALPPGGMTSLALRSREPVSVERYDRQTGEWVMVCVAPCQAVVPRGARLRIPRDIRHDVPGLRSIRLRAERSATTVNIHGGSLRQRWAGTGTAVLSGLGVVTGTTMITLSGKYDTLNGRTYGGAYVIAFATMMFAIGVGLAVAGGSRLREARQGRIALRPGAIVF